MRQMKTAQSALCQQSLGHEPEAETEPSVVAVVVVLGLTVAP